MTYIVNQDRDQVIHTTAAGALFTRPAYYRNRLFKKQSLAGINLMYGNPDKPRSKSNAVLGTFDSLAECIAEIDRYQNCKEDSFWVSGYCNYMGPDNLNELLLSLREEIDATKHLPTLNDDMEVICGEPD
ncbi:hypothetical protein SAMN02745823_03768 [Sporobacter termitidis DSM 10068]|uniref:Uncharacterized protein n=1 Tax=Sporobacter termitidis DSM 10068 TaxID=1123282 RepID=A0A1M5ZHP7_9FIRM|nr:hypothetical protein [Sporobacter termitidis]SHI23817.1 hypothetical protein SAMN02745823_03768 [Sporobacter termitidis DSM 10068]